MFVVSPVIWVWHQIDWLLGTRSQRFSPDKPNSTAPSALPRAQHMLTHSLHQHTLNRQFRKSREWMTYSFDFLPGFCDQFCLSQAAYVRYNSHLLVTVSQSRNTVEKQEYTYSKRKKAAPTGIQWICRLSRRKPGVSVAIKWSDWIQGEFYNCSQVVIY